MLRGADSASLSQPCPLREAGCSSQAPPPGSSQRQSKSAQVTARTSGTDIPGHSQAGVDFHMLPRLSVLENTNRTYAYES